MIFEKIEIKDALLEDLPAITDIYNAAIPSLLVTADTEPVTWESKQAWFEAHDAGKRPLWTIVYESRIIAWVSFNYFYGRPAYSPTAEISIYLHNDAQGKGLGSYLVDLAIKKAPSFGIKTLLAFIFDHNAPSIRLFEKKGFERWAHLPKIADMPDAERGLLIYGLRVS